LEKIYGQKTKSERDSRKYSIGETRLQGLEKKLESRNKAGEAS
jgi:hypothetical protein